MIVKSSYFSRVTPGGKGLASEMVIKAALLGLKIFKIPTSLFPDTRDRPPPKHPV
jgi:hypothetical protein